MKETVKPVEEAPVPIEDEPIEEAPVVEKGTMRTEIVLMEGRFVYKTVEGV